VKFKDEQMRLMKEELQTKEERIDQLLELKAGPHQDKLEALQKTLIAQIGEVEPTLPFAS
jgi:hypothetical protein